MVVLLQYFKSRSGFLDVPLALFGWLHHLICHLKLCSDIMYSSYSSSYQYCLHKFLPVCLPSQMHSCTVYSATVVPQMSFSCASLICCMCCGEYKMKNFHRSGERLHSCVPLHSLPYSLKIKLQVNVMLCETWAITCPVLLLAFLKQACCQVETKVVVGVYYSYILSLRAECL